MKNIVEIMLKILSINMMLMLLSYFAGCQDQKKTAELKGDYFGEVPPGQNPIIFAKGVVSSDMNEVNAAFTINGDEFYFSRFYPGFGYKIMKMIRVENSWSQPEVASFSGKYSDVDIFISPNEDKFFFVSKRPVNEASERSLGYQIWSIYRDSSNLNNLAYLDSTVNFGNRQLYPTVSSTGTLYFNSNHSTGFGKGDFYKSIFTNNQYHKAENLGDSINTIFDETDIFISPDEEYVIFTSIGRPDGYGVGDLYISFNIGNNSWSKSINLGENINTNTHEYSPVVSPDGKYLFFASNRNGNDDIYWVNAVIIEKYKNILK